MKILQAEKQKISIKLRTQQISLTADWIQLKRGQTDQKISKLSWRGKKRSGNIEKSPRDIWHTVKRSNVYSELHKEARKWNRSNI